MKASLNNFLTLLFAVMMSSAVMAQSAEECFKKGSEYIWKDNYAEALRWYRKSADQGYARAYMMLGNMYKSGKGVQEDKTQAVAYYRKAAEKGYSPAQNQMGMCYEIGNGVTRNMTEAVKWYKKAAMTGYAEAQYNLGWCYENGKGVAKNMTEAQKWYKKAEAQDCKSGGLEVTSHRAALAVGKILVKYADAEKDYKKGKEYYDNKNYTEAVKLFRKAADSDYGSAQFYLGLCYEKGYGVTQNYTEAVKWYRKAAEHKNASAQCNLGFFYEKGYGVTKNLTEAVNWYRKAAENGSVVAQCNLAGCYENGIGVTKNIAEAKNWYQKAADKGNERAKKALERLNASATASTTTTKASGSSYGSGKRVVMERRYLVNKANKYCYPATCFRMDNGLQLEIRYFNTDHYQGSYSQTRHGIYIAVGRCEDVNFDWNVKDCDYFDAWYVCPVTTDQWVNEKIEFDANGNVHYYMNGKDMGTHQFEMLKKLANSKTLTFDINPYGWYTGQHHYMDDLKLILPGRTISDNFNDGVLDSNIWQTPTNPSGVREEDGYVKTEQVRTDWPFHLRTKALSLDAGKAQTATNKISGTTTMSAEEYFNKGVEYYENNNYAEAVKWFRKAAEQGYADAQFSLGCCYYAGDGVTKNITEAVKWFRKAAEQGLANAQFNLGACYAIGEGVTKNLTEAAKWYRKAIEQSEDTTYWNMAYQRLAVVYYQMEDMTAYESILKKGAEKIPDEPIFLSSLINLYIGNKDLNNAQQYIDKAIAKFPNNDGFLTLKGQLLDDQEKHEEARALYEKALKLNPNSIYANVAMGIYYYNRASKIISSDLKYDEADRQAYPFFNKAIPYFEKAYSLDPEHKYGYQLYQLYRIKLQKVGESTPEGKQLAEKIKKIKAECDLY